MSLSHKELENFAQRAVTALRSTIARDLHHHPVGWVLLKGAVRSLAKRASPPSAATA